MIGTGKMLESGYSGKKVIALKGFLKDKIEFRHCTASQYKAMIKVVSDEVAELNKQFGGSEFIVDIRDPSVIDSGLIRIWRGRKTTSSFIASVPTFYLLPLNPNLIKEGGKQ